jgi:predicted nucleic acid-binding protein
MELPVVVFDASTAILLARTDLLKDIVERGESWMAREAYKEATAKDSEDARAIARLVREGAIRQARAGKEAKALEQDFRLGRGEAETIAVARAKMAICATDDGPAIRCCKALNVPFVTAIGFLVALREIGDLSERGALELLSKLERYGRYATHILQDAAARIRGAGGTDKGPRNPRRKP